MLRKNFKFISISVLLGTLIITASAGQAVDQRREQDAAKIREVIEAQQAAWNRGDIDHSSAAAPPPQ